MANPSSVVTDPGVSFVSTATACSDGLTVYVHDAQSARLQSVKAVIQGCGARPIPLENSQKRRGDHLEKRPGIAIVGLEPGHSTRELERVRSLKQNNFKVICYEDSIGTRPIGERCEVLLAGALNVLDSARPDFSQALLRLLSDSVRAETERQNEETRLIHAMAELGLIGVSQPMLALFGWAVRASKLSDLPALITGETGTGKEVLIRVISRLDEKRSGGPFIALNCSALNAGVAESELFGHRRGAFTGAERDRKGLFRSAENGILFLDEIGDLDDHLQAKLLRVLQENRVLGVGADQEVRVNVRVLAATNRNLEELVAKGKFRADLYYRLNILSAHIPPLRERLADLKPLTEHFVKKYRAAYPTGTCAVAAEFVEALMQVELPGNARQLDNIIRQALANKSDDSPLNLSDLPPAIWQELFEQSRRGTHEVEQEGQPAACAEPSGGGAWPPEHDVQSHLLSLLQHNNWNLPESLEQCERLLLEAVLDYTHGNQSQTARLLSITPRSVYNKMRKHHLH
ncbi:MAG TPA: sigma 54-interacting transcriptional regulator [Pyrinomonadaceae bacterium]|nr:sigma 54-interacting transcriptional regulator [Pyrinomonadaceae bacterium]